VHPALSIVVFTTLSGIGYGMLAWIGVLAPLGLLPPGRAFAAISLGVALILATVGLLASMLHLGHPERAWRAFSQWRSSWLSREGVSAVATYVPALLFTALWLFEATGGIWAACGLLVTAGSAMTVFSTAMIYRSLKPIRQWDNRWVVPNYLMLAAMTGALWLAAVLGMLDVLRPAVAALAAALTAAAAAVKLGYWRSIDADRAGPTVASATGLPADRPLRPLDAPHTEENYLLKEMGYRVARRHAVKLRRLAMALGFAVPLATLALAWLLRSGIAGAAFALLGALAATAGILIERWLFFAEATHTVALYYRPEASAPAHSSP
jgi:sulfite dehydrogenase (quinone) subunit SoeC